MEIVTERERIEDLAAPFFYPLSEEVKGKISKLDMKSATRADVCEALEVWEHDELRCPQSCDECGEVAERLVRFDDCMPTPDNDVFEICRACLVKALDLLDGEDAGDLTPPS